MQSVTSRRIRADSLENRARLLAAARQLVATGGGNSVVPLEAVARAAGVGIGTLYRHFPTRRALYEALYGAEVEAICDKAGTLARMLPPLDALRDWLTAVVDSMAANRGLRAALAIAFDPEEPLYARSIEMLALAADALLDGARAAGAIHPPLRGHHLIHLLVGIGKTGRDDDWIETLDAVLPILIAGLERP